MATHTCTGPGCPGCYAEAHGAVRITKPRAITPWGQVRDEVRCECCGRLSANRICAICEREVW